MGYSVSPGKPAVNGKKITVFAPDGGEADAPVQEPLAFTSDTVVYIDPARTRTMWQQVNTNSSSANNVGVPLDYADTDGHSVGTIFDLSQHALWVTNSSTSTTRPSLSSSAARNSFLQFDGSEFLFFINSTVLLRSMHKANPVFGLLLWVKRDTDGVVGYIMSNTTGISQRGLLIAVTAANKLLVRLCDGDGASFMVNFTSTATITVADGWVPIRLDFNSTQLTTTIGSNAPETSAIAGGVTNSASNALYIGCLADESNEFVGGIGQILINNRVISSDEWTDWKAFNPTRNAANHRIVARRYDFTDVSLLWQDEAKTTPAANGATVALADNDMASNFGPNARAARQATAANRPTFRTGVQNGLSALDFDGTNDELALDHETIRGGDFTTYIVFRNDDVSFGSHLIHGLSGSENYVVATGESYADGGQIVWHQDVGIAEDSELVNIDGNSFNVVALRCHGRTRTLFNMSGQTNEETTGTKTCYISHIGGNENGIADWKCDGYICLVEQVHGYETNAEVIANINTLKTTFGL